MLLYSVGVSAQHSEWKIFVPSESTIYQGIYADNNQAVITNSESEELYFADYVPFPIPDQTAVSGFSLLPTAAGFTVWLSFSSPIDQYLPGDVIECIDDICELLFSATDSLPVPGSIVIDALHFTGQLLKLSFNIGFSYQGEYIDPKDLYSVIVSNGQVILTNQTNGSGLGFLDNSNLTAYSDSYNGDSGIRYVNADVNYDRTFDMIFANEMLRIDSLNPSAYTAFGLTTETKSISAFHGLHTGIIGFEGESIDVNENQGVAFIDIYRRNGTEGYVAVNVSAQDGTAVEKIDYNFFEDFVAWSDGESLNIPVILNIADNQIIDGDRTMFLVLETYSQFSSIFPVHEMIEIRIIDDEMDDLIFADDFE